MCGTLTPRYSATKRKHQGTHHVYEDQRKPRIPQICVEHMLTEPFFSDHMAEMLSWTWISAPQSPVTTFMISGGTDNMPLYWSDTTKMKQLVRGVGQRQTEMNSCVLLPTHDPTRQHLKTYCFDATSACWALRFVGSVGTLSRHLVVACWM